MVIPVIFDTIVPPSQEAEALSNINSREVYVPFRTRNSKILSFFVTLKRHFFRLESASDKMSGSLERSLGPLISFPGPSVFQCGN